MEIDSASRARKHAGGGGGSSSGAGAGGYTLSPTPTQKQKREKSDARFARKLALAWERQQLLEEHATSRAGAPVFPSVTNIGYRPTLAIERPELVRGLVLVNTVRNYGALVAGRKRGRAARSPEEDADLESLLGRCVRGEASPQEILDYRRRTAPGGLYSEASLEDLLSIDP